jgi:predicted 2-oxoglutarate/Fe(II)-dependent dioxygenase YbiX
VYAEDGTCLYNADYWNDRQCSSEILERLNKQVWMLVDKYIDKMQKTIEDFYKVKVNKRPPVIMKWRPGTEQKPHADKQLNDGRPNAFVDYDLNSLFYYNDDFEGGDLFYPQHDLTVRPRPGLAVMHPGDVNYLHGVTMITKGFRYTTPSFYTVVGS